MMADASDDPRLGTVIARIAAARQLQVRLRRLLGAEVIGG
jgi:hypothetical protein